jgi:hypothetical protein
MRGDNDIFAASRPEPYQVLGLPLLPMSLGHYFTLRRLGCGFVSDSKESLTREDLILACLVCSMPSDRFESWIESGKLSFLQKLWAWIRFIFRQIDRGELAIAFTGTQWEFEVATWGRRVGAFDVEAKAKLFLEYLNESARFPKYWLEREDSSPSGSHWSHSVLITLTGALGFTEGRAMTMPLREALLHFFKHCESNGAVRLMTLDEIAETEVACG